MTPNIHYEIDFFEHGHNVLLRGQSGVGKTMLAQNLGLTALQQGYSVCFTTQAGGPGRA